MLRHELRQDDGILMLNPEGPLEVADFTMLAGLVDAYLERNGKLHGVLIQAKSFPGWKGFGALLAHLKFVKAHHQVIEKVAVVADGAFADIMPNIAPFRPCAGAALRHRARGRRLGVDQETGNA